MMKMMRVFAVLLLVLSGSAVADVFDKAECLATGNNCGGHKWLKRFATAAKCKAEGNCVEKINEAVANNQDEIQGAKDKVRGGLDKIKTFNKCMTTQDFEELKECYEIAKKRYRDKRAKKEEAARALEFLASERKNLGDSVCLQGRILGMKMTVKGFVEQVSGDRIQIRIADASGEMYQGVPLWQNTILWDSYNNWINCSYLKR